MVLETRVRLSDSKDNPLGLELYYLDQGTSLQEKASLLGSLEGALLLGVIIHGSALCKAIHHTTYISLS